MINAIEYKQREKFHHLFSDSAVFYLLISPAISRDLYEIPTEESDLLTGKQVEIASSYYLSPIEVIKSLQEVYFFLEPERVQKFLLDNKELIPVLQEAPIYIQEIFGSSMLIYLDLHSDPEEDWDELFIVIKSPYDAEEAFSLEEKLFEEWFIDIMDKVQGRLNITEEPL